MNNILLASLGANKLSKVNYAFNNRQHTTCFSCLGLVQLLAIDFDSLYVMLTSEARATHEKALLDEAKAFGLKIKIIDITSGKTIEEIWQMFDQITDSFNSHEESNVFLDISNGFRHLPLLSFASLTYLESSRKVKLAGVYYGAFEAKTDNIAPVFDLTPLVNIVKGSYSVKAFEETGAISQLGEFLNDLLKFDKKEQNSLCPKLERLHGLVTSGLTLEAGMQSADLCDWIEKNIQPKCDFKAAAELINRLNNRITKISIHGKEKKQQKSLTMNELARQLNFIEWQINSRNPDTALLLLREWIVNRVWLSENPTGNWLKVKDRENRIEKVLGYWGATTRKSAGEGKGVVHNQLAKSWDGITQKRNEFAHAGFRPDVVNPEKANEAATEFLQLCKDNFADNEFWRLPRRTSDNSKVLISGMGASFGLLYSAVKLVKPDSVVVVSSEKFRDDAADACVRAGFIDQSKLHILAMQDVFSGFAETPALLEKIWPFVETAETAIINLTGGTTAMQWVMQSLYEKAKQNHLPVERVAFVDRRPSAEQQTNPWHLGKLLEIEKLLLGKNKSE